MSYRPKIKQDDETTIDLPIDAETLNGKTAEQWLSEYVDIASDQTITGMKAFSTSVWASISWIGLINDDDAPAWQFNPAGLYFYPDRSKVLENKLIAYNSTSGLFVLGTNFNYTYSIPDNENSTAIATTEWVTTKINTALSSISDITNIVNNTTKIKNSNGGFAAGEGATATYGGAIGNGASAGMGGAIGRMANTSTGGAVGQGANSTTGFAGGYNAIANATGAVQLGQGTNSDANTLQFRGYQVVDADGNIPNERLGNLIPQISNPNILINSNFKINQRGATVYNSSNYGYSVDRWALTSGSAAWVNSRLVPNDNGSITVYNNYSAAIDVNQPIERGVIISGETYTLSATVDGVRKSVTFVADLDMSAASITFTNAVVEFAKFYNSNTDYRVILRTNAGEIVTFNNVKLEKGAQATAYVEPDPAIELLRCQRFYHARKYEVPIIYNPGKGNYGGGQVNFPVTMRVAPTITIIGASISSNSSPLDDTYYNSVDQNGFFAYTGNSYNRYLRFAIRYTADAEI